MFVRTRLAIVAMLAIVALSACTKSSAAPPAAESPTTTNSESPPATVTTTTVPPARERLDLSYSSQSPSQQLDLHLPATGNGPFPVVVWIHGGGWERGDRHLSPQGPQQAVIEAGYAVASVDYRLSHEAVFPAQIQDVKGAVRYLRANATTLGLDATRIGVWGDSAGGHLAALLGTSGDVAAFDDPVLGNIGVSSRVQAVVDWYGPASFATFDSQLTQDHCTKRIAGKESVESRLIGDAVAARPDLARAASPVTYVSADDPPFLIEHGRDDCVVPWQQSDELAKALTTATGASNSTLVVFEHAQHGGNDFVDAANMARVVAFFDTHLR